MPVSPASAMVAASAAATVVNIRDSAEFDVYIGRNVGTYSRSIWANPYRVNVDGTREEVVELYRRYLRSRPDLMARLPELAGKRLGCWCAPKLCHGHVLQELVQEAVSQRIPLSEASELADELLHLLQPGIRRSLVAGSIRRGSTTVGDIELVVTPVVHEQRDIWENVTATLDGLNDHIARLAADQAATGLAIGQRNGDRLKRLWFRGRPVDLFIVRPPATWGCIAMIRTGPAEFSQRMVTPRAKGGRLPATMLYRDGALWEHADGQALPLDREARKRFPAAQLRQVSTPEEEDVFTAMGVPYVEPEARR